VEPWKTSFIRVNASTSLPDPRRNRPTTSDLNRGEIGGRSRLPDLPEDEVIRWDWTELMQEGEQAGREFMERKEKNEW
jgi:hypothetical protein